MFDKNVKGSKNHNKNKNHGHDSDSTPSHKIDSNLQNAIDLRINK